jgi:hypothetical protein
MEPNPKPTSDESTGGVASELSKRRSRYMMLLGLTVYCGAIWYFGWRDIRDHILGADLVKVGVAAGIIFVATWMRIWKWRLALGKGQHAVGLYLMSKATGNVTPGRLGEFAPMVIRDHRTAKVGAWILFDRIVEILVTIALGLYGLAMIDLLSRGQLIATTVLTIAGSLFGVYLVTHRGMFLWIANRFREGGFLHRLWTLLASISEEVYLFVKSLPVVLPITIITKAMDLFAVVLVFRAIESLPSFALMAASKCALAIVSFVPITPTATGVPHGTQAWLMNHVAQIPVDVLVAGIGIEVAIVSGTFWFSVGIGARFIRDAALNAGNTGL